MLQIQKSKKIILSYIANFLIWYKEYKRKNKEWSQWQINDYFKNKALEEETKPG